MMEPTLGRLDYKASDALQDSSKLEQSTVETYWNTKQRHSSKWYLASLDPCRGIFYISKGLLYPCKGIFLPTLPRLGKFYWGNILPLCEHLWRDILSMLHCKKIFAKFRCGQRWREPNYVGVGKFLLPRCLVLRHRCHHRNLAHSDMAFLSV